MNIGYIPSQDVIGLSKLARIADMFSQRLQVQERLTKQVASALMDVLKPKGVAVTMKAQHMCMVFISFSCLLILSELSFVVIFHSVCVELISPDPVP